MNKLRIPYERRAMDAKNPAAARLFDIMARKKTNLAVAADLTIGDNVLALANLLGPKIAVFKTHVDIISDFTPRIAEALLKLSEKHNFLIFEDRKFADIGNTVRLQYGKGIYRIAEWAHLVTVHIVPGPGVLSGIVETMNSTNVKFPRGVVILSQMSSEGSLAKGDYMATAVGLAHMHSVVAGHIGNGSDAKELKKLTSVSEPGHVILTPGVQLAKYHDKLGQKYSSPQSAISAGSDCVIVGRGIYEAENAESEAERYREAAWGAYIERINEKRKSK